MNTDSTNLATTLTFAPRTILSSRTDESDQSDKSSVRPQASHNPAVGKRHGTKSEEYRKAIQNEDGKLPKQDHFPARPSGHWLLGSKIKNHHAISNQLLYHFIHFFARSSPGDVVYNRWMSYLPDMLTMGKTKGAKRSIIAISMLHYGRRANDKTFLMESYKWYGSALIDQRSELELMLEKRTLPDIEQLCTPILLSFFEIGCRTSQTAYSQHLMGAAKLLQAYGPERCQQTPMFELFQTLRLQLVSLLYPT